MRILFFISFLIIASCTKNANTSSKQIRSSLLNIHLTGGFTGKNVRLFVDEQNLYTGNPISQPTIGFAQSTTVILENGIHQISIEYDTLKRDTMLDIHDTLYLQIQTWNDTIRFQTTTCPIYF